MPLLGRRAELRRSSPPMCSATTVTVFVALCLVGVWMTSSPDNVFPSSMPAVENKSEAEKKIDAVADKIKQDGQDEQQEESSWIESDDFGTGDAEKNVPHEKAGDSGADEDGQESFDAANGRVREDPTASASENMIQNAVVGGDSKNAVDRDADAGASNATVSGLKEQPMDSRDDDERNGDMAGAGRPDGKENAINNAMEKEQDDVQKKFTYDGNNKDEEGNNGGLQSSSKQNSTDKSGLAGLANGETSELADGVDGTGSETLEPVGAPATAETKVDLQQESGNQTTIGGAPELAALVTSKSAVPVTEKKMENQDNANQTISDSSVPDPVAIPAPAERKAKFNQESPNRTIISGETLEPVAAPIPAETEVEIKQESGNQTMIRGTSAPAATPAMPETEDEIKQRSSNQTITRGEKPAVVTAASETKAAITQESANQTINGTAAQAFLNGTVLASDSGGGLPLSMKTNSEFAWVLCNTTAGTDYIPCLDNAEAIKKLTSTMHYEHRERHCPDEPPTCLVPLPKGYRKPVPWPHSREKIWHRNVPHTGLVGFKGHQNWVKASGEFLTFPGGGTQFVHGALHYVDNIQKNFPEIAWGKKTRVVLDVGCGVASFGGYLFDRDVLTMSFAPKDEHEAQVQFALERGIPAISAVMGTRRLPYPGGAFDAVHCARCRVPWHAEGGKMLLELDRVLRPGGFFVWSATPVYRKGKQDAEIWRAMAALTKAMCWEMVNKMTDDVDEVSIAIYRKPTTNYCYEGRPPTAEPRICEASDDPNAAWNVPIIGCLHKVPSGPALRGSRWPEQWPERLDSAPYWLNNKDFDADYAHWRGLVNGSYLNGMGINWSDVRNAMDMRTIYGGFAAALRDMNVWVMNVVPVGAPDTLPVIYDRGLFGVYHDWCESFSTYPRSYDLLHADHLFSKLDGRCKLAAVMAEMDRMLRPEGKLIVRDIDETVGEVERMARSLRWEIRISTVSEENEGVLAVVKTMWRPGDAE